MSDSLPEFERPPLDEVVAGIQFKPPESFRAVHLGLYWERVRTRYPKTEDQPSLVPLMESADLKPVVPRFSVQQIDIPRCWFVTETGNELVQLQPDRFIRNWRRITGTEPYPRYVRLRQAFKEEWATFLKFAADLKIGEVVPNQCELTYLNQLEPGEGWKDFTEVSNLFSFWRAPKTPRFLPAPETVSWVARFKLPDGRGRLHVETAPVFRGRDMKLVLSLNLTVRGAPASPSEQDIFSWFDVAHEWIVRAFDELTDPAMHAFWGKKP